MYGQRLIRAAAALSMFAAPVAAQGTLGGYSPVSTKYQVVSKQSTSQTMMGQTQEFETTTNQLLSLALAKSGEALTLTMTVDSTTISSNAPGGAPDVSEANGLKFVGGMAPDGKVGSSQVLDRSGAPSASPFATTMRSILPRLRVGAAKGTTWMDSLHTVGKQGGADLTSESVVTYTFAGDTVITGTTAWKIVGTAATKLTGAGNQGGADFTLTGDAQSTITAVVSVAGVLVTQQTESDAKLTVNVAAAGMVIPITQHGSVKVNRVP